MLNLKKAIYLVLVFYCLGLVSCSASQIGKKENRRYELQKIEGVISVRIVIVENGSKYGCNSAESWRWGAEMQCPTSRIEKMKIQNGNKNIFIPISAFSDLGNVNKLDIEKNENDNQFNIIIAGGDAALSYTVKLKIKNNLLFEKLVRSGEFPEQAWEKTLYKFNY